MSDQHVLGEIVFNVGAVRTVRALEGFGACVNHRVSPTVLRATKGFATSGTRVHLLTGRGRGSPPRGRRGRL